jgi:putative membrane protein
MNNRGRMVIPSITLTLLLSVATAFGAETKSRSENMDKEDTDFVSEAAMGALMEVQLGNAAQSQGSKSQVKNFGRRMHADHTKANEQLKKIAAKKDIKLPTALEGKQKATYDKLIKLRGDEFDREYMSTMVSDHKEDIEKFQKQADNGKDPDMKKFATDQLPILKKHLELAERTQKQVSGTGK